MHDLIIFSHTQQQMIQKIRLSKRVMNTITEEIANEKNTTEKFAIETRIKKTKDSIKKRAICITLGEQSENHVGMVKNGNGLAQSGFTLEDLKSISLCFENTEIINLKHDDEDAYVLLIRNAVNDKNFAFIDELTNFDWDKTYFDVRRNKVLNKRARFNVCFGENAVKPNMQQKQGSIIPFHSVPNLMTWKTKMESICKDKFEVEGNFYYDVKKTGIGFHGDGERKKVIGLNICDEGVEREIHWVWFKNSKPISDHVIIKLYNGDAYIMSEKASGFDWKQRKKATIRHAAGCKNSKYLMTK